MTGKKTSTTIETMEAQRRELDRRIRAAKRAETRAVKAELLSARQDLGVSVAKAAGADTVEAVRLLHHALLSGQEPARLQHILTAGDPDSEPVGDNGVGGGRHGDA